MDRIPEKIDSKYRYVLLASMRAEQLINGAAARTEVASPKQTRLGMQEITEDVIGWGYGPAEEPEVAATPSEEAVEAESEAE
jgi:DNA-directed RNA polymerase subunit K/omega